MTNDEGMITYEYNPFTNISSFKNYNILRHSGTIYAMMQIYNETKDQLLLQAAQQAISFLIEQIKPFNEYCVYMLRYIMFL